MLCEQCLKPLDDCRCPGVTRKALCPAIHTMKFAVCGLPEHHNGPHLWRALVDVLEEQSAL